MHRVGRDVTEPGHVEHRAFLKFQASMRCDGFAERQDVQKPFLAMLQAMRHSCSRKAVLSRGHARMALDGRGAPMVLWAEEPGTSEAYTPRRRLCRACIAEALEYMLEHDGALALVQVRRVDARQAFIERLIDDVVDPGTCLRLLPPFQNQGGTDAFEQATCDLLHLVPFFGDEIRPWPR